MADVIIVGGGLSGLAAACELEELKIPYTLIEVKGRLGGSIASVQRDGFIIDDGPFVLQRSHPWPWLDDLDLTHAVYEIATLPSGSQLVAFKHGTQTLVDTLVSHLRTGRVMPHMSVSTLGRVGHQLAVCLENGMVMQAAALIVAAPARYAERMFYTFEPAISQKLLNFRYDTITRVSLGYRKGAIPIPLEPPPDAGFAFGHWTDSEHRVPPGHVLVQIGLRYPLNRTTPETLIAELQGDMHWSDDAVIAQADYWPESHCLNVYDDGHEAEMQAIEALLPDGVLLIGSDYRRWQVENRVTEGRAAARRIADWLKQ